MRNSLPPRTSLRCRGALALAAAGFLSVSACATTGTAPEGPAPAPPEVYRALLGANAGLSSVRAIAEARIAYAGRRISLPGVLLLDTLDGFRLDVLDPLDRTLAVLYAENGRILQYRPALRAAASLGVFPPECRGVDPAAWVPAVIASSAAPLAGEKLVDRRGWRKERTLERRRSGELHQVISYRVEGERILPRRISWFCAEEAVMQVRLDDWAVGSSWRLPGSIEVSYPKAGLEVRLELREIEGNPQRPGQPLRPRPGPETRWTTWNLPQ